MSPMKTPRLLPMPYRSLLLLVMWLALNSFSAGHLLLGALIAWLIPLLVAPLCDPAPVAHPLKALRYLLVLLVDIVRSTAAVAIQVFRPTSHLTPGFIAVPLDLQEPLPLTILAGSVCLTPGTVSADLSSDKRWLYVHALDIDDEQALVDDIKRRYEKPLMEMFGC